MSHTPPRSRRYHKRRARFRIRQLWPRARTRKRLWRAFRAWPRSLQITAATVTLVTLWFGVNLVYQVVRKPTELFFPVSTALLKSPAETWAKYGTIFRRHSTAVITPEFLAALAQIEGSGNPVALTYWRWNATPDIFEIYRPASSAVGMYQMTDAMYDEARGYCIHRNTVVAAGAWHDLRSCWFNGLYMRVIPSHAVEMTSAFLDRRVAGIIARQRLTNATLQQKQNLAAVIHLCGSGIGEAYARRKFVFTANPRCGDHDARAYVARMNAMRRVFVGLAESSP